MFSTKIDSLVLTMHKLEVVYVTATLKFIDYNVAMTFILIIIIIITSALDDM